MSRRQVLDEHSSRDLTEWRAFDRAFGLSFSGDVQAGIIAAAVWNSHGGMPERDEHGEITKNAEGEPLTRAAVPGDFFPTLDFTDVTGDTDEDEPTPRFHDAAVSNGERVADELEPVDEESEAERVTRAMKNSWAMFALRHNAALRAAKKLEGELGDPPDEPEMN